MKKFGNYFHNLSAYVLYLLAQILLLLYFNQHYGMQTAGMYTLAISVISPVFMFTNFQLKYVVATERSAGYKFIDYFNFRVITSAVAVVVLLAYSLFVADYAYRILFLEVVAYKFFEMLSDIIYGDLQRSGKFNTANYQLSGKSVFYAAIIPADFYLLHNYHLMLLLLTGVYVSFLLYECRRFLYPQGYRPGSLLQSLPTMRGILRQNWQLGFVSFCNSLKVNIPRYFIATFSLSTLSLFSTLNYLNYGMNLLFGALGEVSNVEVSKKPGLIRRALLVFLLLALVYTLAVLAGATLLEQELLVAAFGKLVALPEFLILFILVNGFFVNALQIIQNYFMVFRLNGPLLVLNILEIGALLLVMYLLGGREINRYLNLQSCVALGFGLLSLWTLYKGIRVKVLKTAGIDAMEAVHPAV